MTEQAGTPADHDPPPRVNYEARAAEVVARMPPEEQRVARRQRTEELPPALRPRPADAVVCPVCEQPAPLRIDTPTALERLAARDRREGIRPRR